MNWNPPPTGFISFNLLLLHLSMVFSEYIFEFQVKFFRFDDLKRSDVVPIKLVRLDRLTLIRLVPLTSVLGRCEIWNLFDLNKFELFSIWK